MASLKMLMFFFACFFCYSAQEAPNDIQEFLEYVKRTLDELKKDVRTIKHELKKDVATIKNEIKESSDSIKVLASRMKKVEEQVASQNVTAISVRLENLEHQDFTNQIQAVSQRIGKIEKKVASQNVTAISVRLENLEHQDFTNQIQAVSQRIGKIEKKGVYKCVGGSVSCSICQQSGGGEYRTVNFDDGVRFIAPPTVVLGVRRVGGVDHWTYVSSPTRTSFGMYMGTDSASTFQVQYTACGYT